MHLILMQIHSHIFNLAHQIRRKINTLLKKEETIFETNMKLYNMRFDKIKIWEGVASHKVRLFPVAIYMFKVNNRNTRARCEICLNCCFGVYIVNFEHILHLVLVFLLLTLNMQMPTGLLKTLGERVLVNNLLEYLSTAKILS